MMRRPAFEGTHKALETVGMKAPSRETHVRDAVVLEPRSLNAINCHSITACCSLGLPVVSFYCLDGREAPKETGAARIMPTLRRRHALGLTVSGL